METTNKKQETKTEGAITNHLNKLKADRATMEHLSNITPTDLMKWREQDVFSSYASSSGKNGRVELGVNGHGTFVVRYRKMNTENMESEFFKIAKIAVARYAELLTEK